MTNLLSGLSSKFSFSNQAGVIIVLISVKVIDDQQQEQKGRELQEPAGIISCYKFPRGNVPIDCFLHLRSHPHAISFIHRVTQPELSASAPREGGREAKGPDMKRNLMRASS